MLQLFNRALDAEVQIEAPWMQEFPGGVAIETAAPPPGRRVTFAVNQTQAEGRAASEVERDGRVFLLYELERAWLPGKLGTIELSAPFMRFRYATRFQSDFFGERVAVDRQEAFVYGVPTTLQILPIPDEGRPATFSGAVGQFRITAEATPRQLKAGESIKYKVAIEGAGNIEFFEPPKLEPLEGFHVFGRLDEKTKNARIVTYEISPLSETVKEIPKISFTYFDTAGPGFKTIETQPIPIAVSPLPAGAGLTVLPETDAKRATMGVDDIYDIARIDGERPPAVSIPAAQILLVLGAPWVLAAVGFLALRRRERDLADPRSARARAAAKRFEGALAKGTDEAAAFTRYLADRLGVNEAAVVNAELEQQLRAAGVPADLARDAADSLLRSVEARYGGAAAQKPQFRKLAAGIESALAR
jgi:hypothetical protein